MNRKLTAVATATALSIAGVTAYAQQAPQPTPPQQQIGPGMMGGAGQGNEPGYGPGGRGPRGDYGMGWEMMRGRGWGMGPGMMNDDASWGMGPGMMRGYGGWGMDPGMGMMGLGLGPIGRLDLDDSQRKQLMRIEDDLRRRNWDVMGKMHDEMSRLRDALWATGKRDRAAILAANRRMSDLRQQMLENALDATDKAETLLTPQQREQLRRFGP